MSEPNVVPLVERGESARAPGGEADETGGRAPAERRRGWRVWRQDDHGNRFEVSRGHSEGEARRIAAEYESRGHKQSYGAEPEQESG